MKKILVLDNDEYQRLMRSQAPYFCQACRAYMMFDFIDIIRYKVYKCKQCGESTGLVPMTAYMIENLLKNQMLELLYE